MSVWRGSRTHLVWLIFFGFLVGCVSPAWANIKQAKAYKEAYPDEEKPKCTLCHTSEKPKKEEGQHDWNDYGKKVMKLNEKPDAETYKSAGKA